jgi:hypothetical protein
MLSPEADREAMFTGRCADYGHAKRFSIEFDRENVNDFDLVCR